MLSNHHNILTQIGIRYDVHVVLSFSFSKTEKRTSKLDQIGHQIAQWFLLA
jgi:hypothetical protein